MSLSSGGSTNTLGALRLALSDPSVQAVYLLTDGRPDQVLETLSESKTSMTRECRLVLVWYS